MAGPSPWHSYYESLPDGRFRITSPALIALEMGHGHRILDLELRGSRSKVLLLDKPLKVGTRIPDSQISEFYLQRIRLRDIPGWPPTIAIRQDRAAEPALSDLKLTSARVAESEGASNIELLLDFRGEPCRARIERCPRLLLQSVFTTLTQAGVAGQRLVDVQDMRLIGV